MESTPGKDAMKVVEMTIMDLEYYRNTVYKEKAVFERTPILEVLLWVRYYQTALHTTNRWFHEKKSESESHSIMSDSLWPHEPTSLLCPWNSPGKTTGVGCHFLLQDIVPIQGSDPGLLYCRQIPYHLRLQRKKESIDVANIIVTYIKKSPHPNLQFSTLIVNTSTLRKESSPAKRLELPEGSEDNQHF